MENRLTNYKYNLVKIKNLVLDIAMTEKGSKQFIKLTKIKYALLTEIEAIDKALSTLNDNDLFFISLYINTNMSCSEIADLLNKNYSSIRSKKARILRKLENAINVEI